MRILRVAAGEKDPYPNGRAAAAMEAARVERRKSRRCIVKPLCVGAELCRLLEMNPRGVLVRLRKCDHRRVAKGPRVEHDVGGLPIRGESVRDINRRIACQVRHREMPLRWTL